MKKRHILNIPKWIYDVCTIINLSCSRLVNNYGIEHAGYMTFILLLCLYPALVIFLCITYALNISYIGKYLVQLLYSYLNTDATITMQDSLKDLLKIPQQNLMTIFLLCYAWTASSFIEGIRTILNKIYEVNTPPKYLFRRMLSLLQFMLILFAIFCLILTIFLIPKTNYKIQNFLLYTNVERTKNIALFIVLFAIASYFYSMIPNIKIKFTNIIPGSILTTFLWVISGKFFFRYYIYYSKASIIYGSLGNIILTLLFFYIMNIIFIYGAEFNYALLCRYNIISYCSKKKTS